MSSSKPSNSTSKRAEREADRRKTILRAALEVFSKKGFHGCRIADVAREAGVAYGLVYHSFKDKDELLQSVFAGGWAGFLSRVQDAIAREMAFDAQIRRVVTVVFEACKRDHRGVKVLILEAGRSPSGGAVNRGTEFMHITSLAVTMITQAQARGELPAHFEPLLCATMLYRAIEMSLTAFVLGMLDRKGEAVLDRARDQVVATFLNGVTENRVPARSAG